MTKILTSLINESIDSKYARIYKPFRVESDILKCTITVPVNFIHDFESVPMIKGTSKRGGVIHDYLCRIDSMPVVTKKVAAAVYLEIMEYRDSMFERKTNIGRFNLWWRRWLKYGVVCIAFRYFHKHKVMATLKDMKSNNKKKEVAR